MTKETTSSTHATKSTTVTKFKKLLAVVLTFALVFGAIPVVPVSADASPAAGTFASGHQSGVPAGDYFADLFASGQPGHQSGVPVGDYFADFAEGYFPFFREATEGDENLVFWQYVTVVSANDAGDNMLANVLPTDVPPVHAPPIAAPPADAPDYADNSGSGDDNGITTDTGTDSHIGDDDGTTNDSDTDTDIGDDSSTTTDAGTDIGDDNGITTDSDSSGSGYDDGITNDSDTDIGDDTAPPADTGTADASAETASSGEEGGVSTEAAGLHNPGRDAGDAGNDNSGLSLYVAGSAPDSGDIVNSVAFVWYLDGERRTDKGTVTIPSYIIATHTQYTPPVRVALAFDAVTLADMGVWTLRAYSFGEWVESEYAMFLVVGDFEPPVGIMPLMDWNAGTQGEQTIPAGTVLTVTGTVNVTGRLTIEAGAPVTITGGGTLSANGNFDAIFVPTGAELILNNITIGRGSGLGRGITNFGNLTMNTGSIITGHNAAGANLFNTPTPPATQGTANGGGVFVNLNATFTMNGGTISNNNAGQGGGVLVQTGTFILNSGTFTGNTAGTHAGIRVAGSGSLNINGNFTNDNGIGSASWQNPAITIATDVIVTNNALLHMADADGVLLNNGTINSTSGTITNAGIINNAATGVIDTRGGAITNTGTIDNAGTLHADASFPGVTGSGTFNFPGASFGLTIANGGVGGTLTQPAIAPGGTVNLNAGTQTGQVFTGWTSTSPGVTFTNPEHPLTASFVMPSNDVTVTATWATFTPASNSVANEGQLISAIMAAGAMGAASHATVTVTQNISLAATVSIPTNANVAVITNQAGGVSVTYASGNAFHLQPGSSLVLGQPGGGTITTGNIFLGGNTNPGGVNTAVNNANRSVNFTGIFTASDMAGITVSNATLWGGRIIVPAFTVNFPLTSAPPLSDWDEVQGALNNPAVTTVNLAGLTSPNPARVLTTPPGRTVTIIGGGTLFNDLAFAFGAGSNITINNLNIHSATGQGSALGFTGANNFLYIVGNNNATATNGAGVGVAAGTTGLTIRGTNADTLTAQGGNASAGIGTIAGGLFTGTLTIEGGIIYATGGSSLAAGAGAGIGAGMGGGLVSGSNIGTVTITGGIVTATGAVSGNGANFAAGIGGGSGAQGNGGTVIINGGTVYAISGGGAAMAIGHSSGATGQDTLTVGAGNPTITANAAIPAVTPALASISEHPQNETVSVGNITETLSVDVSRRVGNNFTVQWFSNTANNNTGGTLITGATNATFDIPAGLAVGTHYFFAEVRLTGLPESVFTVRSNAATVTVTAGQPQTVTFPTVTGGAVTAVFGESPVTRAAQTTGTGVITYSIVTAPATGVASVNATTGEITILGVGTATVTATAAAVTGQWLEASATFTLTINPAPVTGATVGTFGAMTFSGAAQTPVATVTLNSTTVTGTWSQVTNVTDTTTFTASGNFTGTITGQNPGMLPLNVAGGTVGAFGALTFNGGAQTPAATVTTSAGNATGTWSAVTNATDTTTFTASGNCTGTITGQNPGMNRATIAAAPAASAYVISGQTNTGATLTLPALPLGATYPAGGTVGGTAALITSHSVSGNTLTFDASNQPDGTTATITFTVADATNYLPFNVAVTITAIDRTIIADTFIDIAGLTLAHTFNGTAQGIGAPSAASGFPGTGAVNITINYGATGATPPHLAGTYTVTITAQNNTHLATREVTLVINRAQLTWAANSGIANNRVFDNTTNATIQTQPTLSGVVAGFDAPVTPGTITFASADAGTQAVIATGFSAAAGANYYAPTAQPTFADAVITALPVTVTPDAGQSKVFGAPDPEFTFTHSPAIFGSFTGSLGRVAGEDAGAYAFTIGTLSAGGNYVLSLGGTESFEIMQTPLPASTYNVYVTRSTASSGNTVNLLDVLPINRGAATPAFGAPSVTGANSAYVTGAAVSGSDLTFNTTANAPLDTATITVPVSGMTNFQNGDITVTVYFIDQQVPVVNWPTNLTAAAGQTLADVTLPANTGGTAGTFSWAEALTTPVGDAGNRTHELRFTPADTAVYATVTQNVNVVVTFEVIPPSIIAVNAETPVIAQIGGTSVITVTGENLVPANMLIAAFLDDGGYAFYRQVPAQIMYDRTMVPLRFVSEFFGALVTWDGEAGGIEILRNPAPFNPTPVQEAHGNPAQALREDEDETEAPAES
ncbi:MAG: stalk domain-containing protein [Defluviitaleaceae bacterium]|nr:stalk domain-containing protein [Defluviitaleaceae bacterium]